MAQLPHLSITTTPSDITIGLTAGCYVAQVRTGSLDGFGVLYATGVSAPTDLNDFFSCLSGRFFTFEAPGPVWCRASVGVTFDLALAPGP